MKQLRVSNRYAKSILTLAMDRNELEKVRQDMQLIGDTIGDSRDLSNALKSPIIKSDAKLKVLDTLFGDKVNEMVMGFVRILVRKGREHLLHEICEEFEKQYKTLKNITSVVVTTAIPVDDQLRVHIESFIGGLKQSLGITGHIDLREEVRPEIIGGFIVRAGDLQIDHSVSRKFDDLRIAFSKNLYISEL